MFKLLKTGSNKKHYSPSNKLRNFIIDVTCLFIVLGILHNIIVHKIDLSFYGVTVLSIVCLTSYFERTMFLITYFLWCIDDTCNISHLKGSAHYTCTYGKHQVTGQSCKIIIKIRQDWYQSHWHAHSVICLLPSKLKFVSYCYVKAIRTWCLVHCYVSAIRALCLAILEYGVELPLYWPQLLRFSNPIGSAFYTRLDLIDTLFLQKKSVCLYHI